MAEGTRYYLEGTELEYASFELPYTPGPTPDRAVIVQPIDLADELEALPRVVTFKMHCASEDNSAQPSHGDYEFPGWRVREVIRRDTTCEVHLRDVRDDLDDHICPADFLLRWLDGYLEGTNHPTLRAAVEYLAGLIPELAEALDEDAFAQTDAGAQGEGGEPADILPEGLPLSGGRLTQQLEALASLVGATLSRRPSTGKLFFAKLGAAPAIITQAYNWDGGFEPPWMVANRKRRDLPRVIRVPYRELHALRLIGGNDRETSSYPPELRMGLDQVYAHGAKFLLLTELLVEFGLAETAITDAQICRVINTENFDGTALEPVGGFDADAKALISIIKRDWRSLWRIRYPANQGRRGGWVNLRFGYFSETTDKDGLDHYSADVTSRGVRMEWTEWLARAEEQSSGHQSSIIGAVVARSHQRPGSAYPLPDSPFVASWVSEQDGVLRVAPGEVPGTAQHLWPGRMTTPVLTITDIGLAMDDQGVTTGTTGGLGFPTASDVKFSETFTIEVFVIAERRLPNTRDRWTTIEIPAFADGEREALDIEVGDEVFALRDYVDTSDVRSSREPAGDGLGQPLNLPAVAQDAARRARVVMDRLAEPLGGPATAVGAEAAFDNAPGSGLASVTLDVDGCYVASILEAGSLDNEESRQARRRRREAGRTVEYGGKVAAL